MSLQIGSSTGSLVRSQPTGMELTSCTGAIVDFPICGIQTASLIDYPGNVCATLFVRRCNFRCPYCHNSELVLGSPKARDLGEVVKFLEKRSGLLDGVCVTGGEPTLYPDVERFVEAVKALGLKVKLDTNGTNPSALAHLLERRLVDYVAIDVKAPLGRYAEVVCMTRSPEGRLSPATLVDSSVRVVMSSDVDYEMRTTVCPSLIDIDDILEIGEWLNGARRYVLQQYRPAQTVLDPSVAGTAQYPVAWFKRAARLVSDRFGEVILRGM